MKRKQQLFFVLFCLVIALLSLAPYWTHGVNLEHDTFTPIRITILDMPVRCSTVIFS